MVSSFKRLISLHKQTEFKFIFVDSLSSALTFSTAQHGYGVSLVGQTHFRHSQAWKDQSRWI